jgi:hypothetical protein
VVKTLVLAWNESASFAPASIFYLSFSISHRCEFGHPSSAGYDVASRPNAATPGTPYNASGESRKMDKKVDMEVESNKCLPS